jgi:Protein of unknown function (DUF3768)
VRQYGEVNVVLSECRDVSLQANLRQLLHNWLHRGKSPVDYWAEQSRPGIHPTLLVGLFFKIDYFNRALTAYSPDPSDPSVTERVMTITLAEGLLKAGVLPSGGRTCAGPH